MRLRLAFLALTAATTACTDNDSGASFADEVTAPGHETDAPGTTQPGDESGADSSSGDPEDPTTTTLTTDDPVTTGDPVDDTTTAPLPDTTTGPDEPDTTTTGDPVDDCPRVRVTVPAGDALNIRPDPSTAGEPLGVLQPGQIVDVLSVTQGEVLEGNGTWYEIDGPVVDGYVWGGLVECTQDALPDDGFYLPLQCGAVVVISQGNNGGFSHVGQSLYAFDFSLGIGTPLVAIADGTVSHMYGGTKPGDPCYDGGGQECNSAANYVSLLHTDGTRSMYAHLSEPVVSVGQFVARGTVVGKSGSTGWSTGPHAHVARTENCGSAWCQSIPVTFVDVPGDGVPDTGDTVTSMNCP